MRLASGCRLRPSDGNMERMRLTLPLAVALLAGCHWLLPFRGAAPEDGAPDRPGLAGDHRPRSWELVPADAAHMPDVERPRDSPWVPDLPGPCAAGVTQWLGAKMVVCGCPPGSFSSDMPLGTSCTTGPLSSPAKYMGIQGSPICAKIGIAPQAYWCPAMTSNTAAAICCAGTVGGG